MHLSEPSAGMSHSLPAVNLVGKVVRTLCELNATGMVLMRFERCAYLQFNNQLTCFGLRTLGASTICGLFEQSVEVLPENLTRGAKAQLCADGLLINNRHFFDMSRAQLYEPISQAGYLNCEALLVQKRLLAQLHGPVAGLAPLLPYLAESKCCTDALISAAESDHEVGIIALVLPAINRLSDQIRAACAVKNAAANGYKFESPAFQKLLGAGPGLTPSGDDFICGVFAALYLSGRSDVAQSMWESIQNIAASLTTPVSVALLEQSAKGESGERLDAVVNAYINYPTTSADQFQRLVDQIGETSGWDWLVGFVLCIDIMSTHTKGTKKGRGG